MNKMYEKISHIALRNVSLALPDPRTCSPWSTTFRGKTGSPPVATLTLSPLEGTAVMLWAAWQNCGPAEDTLSTEAKSRVKLTIYMGQIDSVYHWKKCWRWPHCIISHSWEFLKNCLTDINAQCHQEPCRIAGRGGGGVGTDNYHSACSTWLENLRHETGSR